jgi:hypothetical protein
LGRVGAGAAGGTTAAGTAAEAGTGAGFDFARGSLDPPLPLSNNSETLAPTGPDMSLNPVGMSSACVCGGIRPRGGLTCVHAVPHQVTTMVRAPPQTDTGVSFKASSGVDDTYPPALPAPCHRPTTRHWASAPQSPQRSGTAGRRPQRRTSPRCCRCCLRCQPATRLTRPSKKKINGNGS